MVAPEPGITRPARALRSPAIEAGHVGGGGGLIDEDKLLRIKGFVSRVTPVHTAVRNCTRDEGGPFEVGNQVLISNHRKLLWSKSHGGERCGKAGTRFRQV